MLESISPLPFEGPQKSKPFNWKASDCLDFNMRSEFSDRMQKFIEEIHQDKIELYRWRFVAAQVSATTFPGGSDAVTPEAFRKAQVDGVVSLLDRVDHLSKQVERLQRALDSANHTMAENDLPELPGEDS
jgi:hypothetical protein